MQPMNSFTEPSVGEPARLHLYSVYDSCRAMARYASEHPDPAKGPGCPVQTRELSHEQGKAHSQLSGEQPVFAFLAYDDVRCLEGRLLTIVDASFTDREQRKAVKDLIRNAVWFDWVPNLDTDEPTRGKPDLNR